MVNIMIVDDSQPWREFASLLVKKRAEWNLLCEVATGLEGVDKCMELCPDVMLLDLSLPDIHGIEVIKRIRSKGTSTKVIVVTNEGAAEIVEVALGLGAAGYVLKPDAGRDLLPSIDSALRGKTFISNGLNKDMRITKGRKPLE
jgi:DNA-binding NarL/FixJ family response regulator